MEVLYGIPPAEWGRGYATEIAPAILRYGFETADIACTWGLAAVENVASRHVLEKVGRTFEGYDINDGREETRYAIRKIAKGTAGSTGLKARRLRRARLSASPG